MSSSKVIKIDQEPESRAERLMLYASRPLDEDDSLNGLPEFQHFPKVRERYNRIPDRLKKKPASTAHVVALAQLVRDALNSLTAEVEKLGRLYGKK